MEYPVFDVPFLGGSLLIAAVAVFHVFIAHFSVGAGFFMASAERRAIREDDGEMLSFLKKYSLLILLAPYVLGTVTGVGIWFTIAVVSPRAVSLLIHQFVWGWATEWVMFIVEVVAIYLYFYTWGRVSHKAHNTIGWVFAIASAVTLLIINGILSFMLTPGGWEAGGPAAFWKGIFNPGYWPTTAIRLLVSLALAGVGGIALATFANGVSAATREKVVAHGYKFIAPSVLCVALAGWAFAVLPERAQTFLMGGAPAMMLFMAFGLACFGILALSAIASLLRKDYSTSTLGACMLVLLAFVSFGAFEFLREGARKPYLIEGFMYSTGVTTAKAEGIDTVATLAATQRNGVLSVAPWCLPSGRKLDQLSELEKGEAVYKAACLRCHSVVGYNAITPLIKSWGRETIRTMLDRLEEVKPSMPPFPGTASEKDALTAYLVTLNK